MTTNQSSIDFLLGQLSGLPRLRARKRFGEYVLYCDEARHQGGRTRRRT